jgi:hypothetical protein
VGVEGIQMTQVIKRSVTFIMLLAVAIFAVSASLKIANAQEVLPDGTVVEGENATVETSTGEETTTPAETPAPEAPAEEQPAEEQAVEETTPAEEVTTEAPEASADVFAFTAQPGDSYTKIARKSVQIYGIENQVDLSGAQIVFVETNLTIAADSPMLNVDEEVSISKSLVGEWVEKAKNLTDEQKAAWQRYADHVDFNTDNVGEAR